MLRSKVIFSHSIAIITVIVWGATFVSTKILINEGLTPAEIFFYRFLLAYCCILFVSHKQIWAKNIKDELLMFLCGLFGGSLYFIAENEALGITLASNVSLLICTAPIITIILSYIFNKTPIYKNMLLGSVIALAGVGLVVFNGNYVFQMNPIGDVLTIFAAVMWACYCLVLKKLSKTYDTLLITRKVFFYGLFSISFYFWFYQFEFKKNLLLMPVVYLNLIFLGLIASMLCYIMWNYAVKELGASTTTNYLYIVPFVTILTSTIFLQETITIISLLGGACIIGGVYLTERKKKVF